MFALLLAVALTPAAEAGSAMVDSRAEARVTVTGRGEILVVDFRPDSIRGWKITAGKLFLFRTSGELPRSITVSTVAARWTEDKPTAIAALVFGKGGSVTADCAVTDRENGWMEVQLPPRLLQALADGAAHGFAIEQKGIRINGRAPVFRQPYILAEGQSGPPVP